jgi:uncharacterized protein (DUF1919 family)
MIKSIISNNCFGGCIAKDYHMEFCSPTINLQILPEEFPKFCANVRHYMDAELVEYTELSDEHKTYCEHMFGYVPTEYPMGLIDDILVVFQHYESFAESKECWDKRKARVDFNDMCYFLHAKNETYADCVRQFLALNLPHGEAVTEGFDVEGAHRFDTPPGLDCFYFVGGKRVIEQNFSIRKWLEGEEQ